MMRIRIAWAWLCWRLEELLAFTNRWRAWPRARGETLKRVGDVIALKPMPTETPRQFRARCVERLHMRA